MDKLKAKQAQLERRQRRVRGKVQRHRRRARACASPAPTPTSTPRSSTTSAGVTLAAASTVDSELQGVARRTAPTIDAATKPSARPIGTPRRRGRCHRGRLRPWRPPVPRSREGSRGRCAQRRPRSSREDKRMARREAPGLRASGEGRLHQPRVEGRQGRPSLRADRARRRRRRRRQRRRRHGQVRRSARSPSRRASRTRRRTCSRSRSSNGTIPHAIIGEFGAGRVHAQAGRSRYRHHRRRPGPRAARARGHPRRALQVARHATTRSTW